MHGAFRTALALSCLALFGCKSEEDRSPQAIGPPGATRCIQGIQRAVNGSTAKEVSTVYYEECADMFSQPGCRDAWRAAAQAPAHLQLPGIADACRKAYCPSYSAFSFDICRDDFSASPDALLKTWPPLFDAILARETGPVHTQVSSAMLILYARLKQLEAAAPPPSEAPPPSGMPAPSAAGSGEPPAPEASSAGAVPSASAKAGSARPGALEKGAPAKAKPAAKHP